MWFYYENGYEQKFDFATIKDFYNFLADKSEYPDFDCWLYDMEKCQILNRA